MDENRIETLLDWLDQSIENDTLINTKGARGILISLKQIVSSLKWQPMDTAPHDRRVLVRCGSGEMYIAHWAQNPETGHEAWIVCEWGDCEQALVIPTEWREILCAE